MMMNMYIGIMKTQERDNIMNEEEKVKAPEYVREEDICLCGELIAECKDAYDHMAKGY